MKITDDLSIPDSEPITYYPARISRSAVKKNNWNEISDFFRNSVIPSEEDTILLDAVEAIADWKRYVEQDLDEIQLVYNTSDDKLPDKVIDSDNESENKKTVTIKLEKGDNEKLWVLSGLQSKPTKSLKDSKFEFPLPEGAGLRRLNNVENFKLPWSIYCPTINNERNVIKWTHNLKRNLWRVENRFKNLPKNESRCGCKGGFCDSNCPNRYHQIECFHYNCSFGDEDCGNRQFTNLLRDLNLKRLYSVGYEVIQTGKQKGAGLFSVRSYNKHSLVVEYTGEVITLDDVETRLDTVYKNSINYYFLGLDDNLIVDAGQKGSVARFANHSCYPNTEIQKWYVDGEPRIGLFAIRPITAGDEITYDYNFEWFDNSEPPQKCYCESKNCRGFIGKSVKSNDHQDPNIAVDETPSDVEDFNESEEVEIDLDPPIDEEQKTTKTSSDSTKKIDHSSEKSEVLDKTKKSSDVINHEPINNTSKESDPIATNSISTSTAEIVASPSKKPAHITTNAKLSKPVHEKPNSSQNNDSLKKTDISSKTKNAEVSKDATKNRHVETKPVRRMNLNLDINMAKPGTKLTDEENAEYLNSLSRVKTRKRKVIISSDEEDDVPLKEQKVRDSSEVNSRKKEIQSNKSTTTTSVLKKPTASAPKKPTTSEPENPIPSESTKPTASGPKKPTHTESRTPIQSRRHITSASRRRTSESKRPTSSESKRYTFSGSKKRFISDRNKEEIDDNSDNSFKAQKSPKSKPFTFQEIFKGIKKSKRTNIKPSQLQESTAVVPAQHPQEQYEEENYQGQDQNYDEYYQHPENNYPYDQRQYPNHPYPTYPPQPPYNGYNQENQYAHGPYGNPYPYRNGYQENYIPGESNQDVERYYNNSSAPASERYRENYQYPPPPEGQYYHEDYPQGGPVQDPRLDPNQYPLRLTMGPNRNHYYPPEDHHQAQPPHEYYNQGQIYHQEHQEIQEERSNQRPSDPRRKR